LPAPSTFLPRILPMHRPGPLDTTVVGVAAVLVAPGPLVATAVGVAAVLVAATIAVWVAAVTAVCDADGNVAVAVAVIVAAPPPLLITLLVIVTVQVTVVPPPAVLADPLHWSTVTGGIEVVVAPVVTVQVMVPPAEPEALHWLTVFVVVGALGGEAGVWVQCTVFGGPMGLLHWLIDEVEAAPAGPPVMLLVIVTVHVTVAPPLPEPLHCRTVVTGTVDDVGGTDVTRHAGRPLHAWTVEEVVASVWTPCES
jgi:hypothetical protein